jgi:hypothetical protein
MSSRNLNATLCLSVIATVAAVPAMAQSLRIQCPTSTITHPDKTATQMVNSAEPAYTGSTMLALGAHGYLEPAANAANVNGAIKCQQISGGDGYATMATELRRTCFPSDRCRDLPTWLRVSREQNSPTSSIP